MRTMANRIGKGLMMAGFGSKTSLLVLITVVSCGQPSGGRRLAEERAAREFTPAMGSLPGLVSDAERLDQQSNRERLEALTVLLAERNLDFEIQRFQILPDSNDSPLEGTNVVLTFGSASEILVVGAHFDAVLLPGGQAGPGMVDNAAGVVVLIRLADVIQDLCFSKRVVFVFFDLEEAGLFGSAHFVNSLQTAQIEAMINVDIVGYGDTVIFGPSSDSDQVQLEPTVRRVCSRLSADCFLSPRLPAGDYQSFQSIGVPSTSLAILPSAEAHQAWLMFNRPTRSGLRDSFVPSIARFVHTCEDTADKLDPVAMTLAYNVLGYLLFELGR